MIRFLCLLSSLIVAGCAGTTEVGFVPQDVPEIPKADPPLPPEIQVHRPPDPLIAMTIDDTNLVCTSPASVEALALTLAEAIRFATDLRELVQFYRGLDQ